MYRASSSDRQVNGHFAILMAARLQQQRLQAGMMDGLQFRPESLA